MQGETSEREWRWTGHTHRLVNATTEKEEERA